MTTHHSRIEFQYEPVQALQYVFHAATDMSVSSLIYRSDIFKFAF